MDLRRRSERFFTDVPPATSAKRILGACGCRPFTFIESMDDEDVAAILAEIGQGEEGVEALKRGELREKIEIMRAELNAMAEQMGALAAEVLEKSQELDKLINEYYRMQGE